MAKFSKIDLIRDELCRIASKEDRQDFIAPTMMAYWSYTRVMVLGKIRNQAIDFDLLIEILKKVPAGSGEENFWRTLDSVNSVVLDEKVNRECEVIQLLDYKKLRKNMV